MSETTHAAFPINPTTSSSIRQYGADFPATSTLDVKCGVEELPVFLAVVLFVFGDYANVPALMRQWFSDVEMLQVTYLNIHRGCGSFNKRTTFACWQQYSESYCGFIAPRALCQANSYPKPNTGALSSSSTFTGLIFWVCVSLGVHSQSYSVPKVFRNQLRFNPLWPDFKEMSPGVSSRSQEPSRQP